MARRSRSCALSGRCGHQDDVPVGHRLSTVREADRIIVLRTRDRRDGDARRVAARGGRYADLWRAATGGSGA
jgi:ABC-type transport system involved in Fe-S cluster assembly fused permease/ATPase subunit